MPHPPAILHLSLWEGGCTPESHHYAKCLQIVLVFHLWGGCWEAAITQNGSTSPHDTPPLWCCTWPSINKQMKGSPWR